MPTMAGTENLTSSEETLATPISLALFMRMTSIVKFT